MSFNFINCTHRHCVFTIAEELHPFFPKDRAPLGCLFSAVSSVVLNMFHKDNKAKKFNPGFICVLHTFGRDFCSSYSFTYLLTVSLLICSLAAIALFDMPSIWSRIIHCLVARLITPKPPSSVILEG